MTYRTGAPFGKLLGDALLEEIYETKAQVERETGMKTYWMVHRADGTGTPPARKHDTEISAIAEADRLAKKERRSFTILKAIGIIGVTEVEVRTQFELMKEPSPKVKVKVVGRLAHSEPTEWVADVALYDPDCAVCEQLKAHDLGITFPMHEFVAAVKEEVADCGHGCTEDCVSSRCEEHAGELYQPEPVRHRHGPSLDHDCACCADECECQ